MNLVVPVSTPIRFSTLASVYGVPSTPYRVSQLLKGGSYVPNVPQNSNVGSSTASPVKISGYSNSTVEYTITLPTGNTENYNWGSAVSSTFGGVNVARKFAKLVVPSAAVVGATSTGNAALTIGTFPSGTSLTIDIYGSIRGAGGAGGTTGAGANGGPAINADVAQTTSIIVRNGASVYGGGGGGGKAGAGGAGGKGGNGSYTIRNEPGYQSVSISAIGTRVNVNLGSPKYYVKKSLGTSLGTSGVEWYWNDVLLYTWEQAGALNEPYPSQYTFIPNGYDVGSMYETQYSGQVGNNKFFRIYSTSVVSTTGGTGGSGGAGGNGGRGAGYNQTSTSGSGGSSGSGGAAGGTNAGTGGTGGSGGTGGNGGALGTAGASGSTGNTGSTGTNGTVTNAVAAVAGSSGSGGGSAGASLYKPGRTNVTVTTEAGSTLLPAVV